MFFIVLRNKLIALKPVFIMFYCNTFKFKAK
nr:MAG TPA: hypothetical protein [Caudoviricetes sp.]